MLPSFRLISSQRTVPLPSARASSSSPVAGVSLSCMGGSRKRRDIIVIDDDDDDDDDTNGNNENNVTHTHGIQSNGRVNRHNKRIKEEQLPITSCAALVVKGEVSPLSSSSRNGPSSSLTSAAVTKSISSPAAISTPTSAVRPHEKKHTCVLSTNVTDQSNPSISSISSPFTAARPLSASLKNERPASSNHQDVPLPSSSLSSSLSSVPSLSPSSSSSRILPLTSPLAHLSTPSPLAASLASSASSPSVSVRHQSIHAGPKPERLRNAHDNHSTEPAMVAVANGLRSVSSSFSWSTLPIVLLEAILFRVPITDHHFSNCIVVCKSWRVRLLSAFPHHYHHVPARRVVDNSLNRMLSVIMQHSIGSYVHPKL
jgi:hypothetical protein